MQILRLHDPWLARMSYLVACRRSKECIAIDPARDVDQVIRSADLAGMRLVGVVDTHFHADYLSGLAGMHFQHEIPAWISGEGERSKAAQPDPIGRLCEGDEIAVGSTVRLRILHTPGHTPESLSFLAVSTSGEPSALFTGDFLFNGEVGRPDLGLLAGLHEHPQVNALQMAQALQSLKTLPDDLRVCPGHTAGSACGRNICRMHMTTLGIERRINRMLRSAEEPAFASMLLEGIPEPPSYFRRIKLLNIQGVPQVVWGPPPRLSPRESSRLDPGSVTVIDTRAPAEFVESASVGALNIPLGSHFAVAAGGLVDPDSPVALIVSEHLADEALRVLFRIGVDRVVGWMTPEDAVDALGSAEPFMDSCSERIALRMLRSGHARTLDVRSREEFEHGHIDGAINVPLERLDCCIEEFEPNVRWICYCRNGTRGAIAASFLKRKGIDAMPLEGGYVRWSGMGFPSRRQEPPAAVDAQDWVRQSLNST